MIVKSNSKRLFKVMHRGKCVEWFKNKVEAKKVRDGIPGAFVARGPDHARGETHA